ncbi:hypothetical protein PP175_25745 (plasmid) [Aneurinibacillus sp. Ricciae_BoGa-3]|uniref:hypothetical protein n=1 Tax=Aneurinibacillus sp. Ricciae_BoGa-3 TaxID=3022697 RepID=UPI0023408847|nr:hypothetical protein [Aneurinibacillus sp. Ricciae_BoGa-3]WCK57472.1 hypothetical protein PP175_25745 [Aneurinibacillus sp. Ricciae_BoGa-3]
MFISMPLLIMLIAIPITIVIVTEILRTKKICYFSDDSFSILIKTTACEIAMVFIAKVFLINVL